MSATTFACARDTSCCCCRVGAGEAVTIPGRDLEIKSTGERQQPASPPKVEELAEDTTTRATATAGGTSVLDAEDLSSDGPAKEVEAAAEGGANDADGGDGLLPVQAKGLHKNGGVVADKYAWSQTKDTVTINGFVPKGTRAGSVVVAVHPQKIKITASSSSKAAKEKVVVVEGDLWSEVEEVDAGDDLDWEVRDVPSDPKGRRVVSVTMTKKTAKLGFGVVMWWKAALKDGVEIDVATIGDRRKGKGTGKSFSTVFKEAQDAFVKKLKTQGDTRVLVDVSDSDSEDEGEQVGAEPNAKGVRGSGSGSGSVGGSVVDGGGGGGSGGARE
jgi:hypothetical protein